MSTSRLTVTLDGGALSLEDLAAVADGRASLRIGDDAMRRMAASRAVVERAAAGGVAVYGVNTGFGSLAQVRIAPEDLRQLQRNLVRSHASGVGDLLSIRQVRGMMAALAASLSRGLSGVRPAVVEQILRLLDADVTPCVPGRGSVGASGDLAPLAHVALALSGEGDVMLEGVLTRAGYALKARGIEPLELDAKEGLALINGTHAMASIGGLALLEAERLVRAAIRSTALAIDAALASGAFLDPRIHEARHQPGQIEVAAALRREIEGSAITASHRDGDPRVQDPYSFRCAPQVLGAAVDTLRFARQTVERELGAVTDNPLVFADAAAGGAGDPAAPGGPIVSGGNFHGMPLAIAFDAAKIAVATMAGIAERRVYWVLGGADPFTKLPQHLAHAPGLHSGLMVAQYAAAACCNEIQTLCAPASVANIPTCAGMEDYNSFGATSAHQLDRAVRLARSVIAIELLCMTEALERHRPLHSSPRVEATVELVRKVAPAAPEDRPPAPRIEAIEALLANGAFDADVGAVEGAGASSDTTKE